MVQPRGHRAAVGVPSSEASSRKQRPENPESQGRRGNQTLCGFVSLKTLNLNINFSSLTDADFVKIEDAVGDFYTQEAQETDEATDSILLCESILDKI